MFYPRVTNLCKRLPIPPLRYVVRKGGVEPPRTTTYRSKRDLFHPQPQVLRVYHVPKNYFTTSVYYVFQRTNVITFTPCMVFTGCLRSALTLFGYTPNVRKGVTRDYNTNIRIFF